MKFTRVFAFMALAGLAGSAFATNGDNLIGLGVQSRALGGTGTAAFFGSENALTNPALLGKMQGSEFAIGGTAFMPDVKATTDVAAPGFAGSASSDADLSVIPEVSMATRINDNLTFGLGMFGTAGMGVDYRGDTMDNDLLFQGYTNLQLMKFVPSLAYNSGPFGVGGAVVIQYGALDINYVTAAGTTGDGTSTDLQLGFNLGGYFDVTKDLTLGLAYQSEIGMEYDGQLTTAANGFGVGSCAACTQTIVSDKLAQPAEIKAGVAYTTGPWMLTGDYKRIMWGDADGYKDFNWDDQDVFGLGVKYSGTGWWVGAGYNYGEDPIAVLPNVANPMGTYVNQAINLFNNHFFPAVVESHFTVGGGYALGKNTMLEGALVYADEVSKTIDTSAISAMLPTPTDGPSSHTVEHSQLAVTVSVRMNF